MTDTVPPDQVRASDVDRKAVQDRLHVAHAEGALTLGEFDGRVAEAWQAKTRGELARLTADLPAPVAVPVAPAAVAGRHRGPIALRVLATVWLSVSAVNVVIWSLVCLTRGELVYPWWLWVACPPGAVLAVLWWMTDDGRPERG